MSTAHADIGNSTTRHARAVAQTLGWADAAAGRGDHAGAMGWLRTVEIIGDELSDAYQAKRHWRLDVRAQTQERKAPRRCMGLGFKVAADSAEARSGSAAWLPPMTNPNRRAEAGFGGLRACRGWSEPTAMRR